MVGVLKFAMVAILAVCLLDWIVVSCLGIVDVELKILWLKRKLLVAEDITVKPSLYVRGTMGLGR
jgi:hypothetical protein